MPNKRIITLCAMAAICFATQDLPSAEPFKLIFDTDIGNDVDDALALGMIHSLQSRGLCELLAVTITKDHPDAAPYVDAVNTFYGRPDIPIGRVQGGKTPEAGKYLPLKQVFDAGRARYPHDENRKQGLPNAVFLLRKLLNEQPDRSVVIVQVGFSTNLARLLESKADVYSDLDGEELVAQKVKLLSMMAGAFRPIDGNTRFCEYNIVEDKASAKYLVNNWPTDIVFSGFEIGIAVPYPAKSILQDYGYVKHHPLAESYILYEPPPHNRPTWDLTSVLYAVCPDRGYFELSPPGTVTVEDDGFTKFTEVPNGKCRYLILPAAQIERVKEAFVQLCSQPPAR
jgi:purine nucleosidase